ncbi:hypothetical protein [Sphingomonas gilva]|uniref:hypothetical protein n=1 Tax=Sphingomonas gilva TaxID=2305907 RepID=UPI001CA3EBE5|nr:hypothetical protein [Sphingomonas gilva]
MMLFPSILPVLGVAALAVAAQAQTTPGLAGRWTQASSGKELVLAPRIKLQPNVGVGYGTNLGGSVGYGSMTRTTIVTEPTMMDVARSMTLAIEADGRFKWTIVKRHAERDDCVRTSTEVKEGKVQALAGKMVFAVSGGTERWSSSCGRSGSAAIAAARESYDVTVQGGVLRLASGPSRWTFSRG